MWCYNRLIVSGPPEEQARLRAEVASQRNQLDFELVLPTPRHHLADNHWRRWRRQCWGTSWGSNGTYFRQEDEDLVYYFDTAWEPPMGIVGTLQLNYPSLAFELQPLLRQPYRRAGREAAELAGAAQ